MPGVQAEVATVQEFKTAVGSQRCKSRDDGETRVGVSIG